MIRFLLVFVILLVFPALEIWLLIKLSDRFGWYVLLYLLLAVFAGVNLIVSERGQFPLRMASAIMRGGSPFHAFWQSGRTLLAGTLLIFPGVISDVMALLLILWGWLASPRTPVPPPADDGVIEGEFRRELDAALPPDRKP